MPHRILIQLTDEDYEILDAQSKANGTSIAIEVAKTLQQRLHTKIEPMNNESLTILKQLFDDGFIENIATGEDDSLSDDELERIAASFGGGKMASEMVIEDRGPE